MTDRERYERALIIWQKALNGFLLEVPMRFDMVQNATARIVRMVELLTCLKPHV